VTLLDRDLEPAAALASSIGGLALQADVADVGSVEAAFAHTADHFGVAPRIVVNCAGVGTAGRILPRDGRLGIEAFEQMG